VIEDDELCRQNLKKGDMRHIDARHVKHWSSKGLEEQKLRQNDTVGDRSSKSNAETERKLAESSAEP
jgi:hypothetical protein